MTKLGSIKETGEELPEAEWRRFEDAVETGKGSADRAKGESSTLSEGKKVEEKPSKQASTFD